MTPSERPLCPWDREPIMAEPIPHDGLLFCSEECVREYDLEMRIMKEEHLQESDNHDQSTSRPDSREVES